MTQKEYKQIEDFLIDDSFQKYCSGENEQCVQYWTQYLLKYPEQSNTVLKARHLYQILVGNRKPVNEQIERLKNEIRNSHSSKKIFQLNWKMWSAAAAVLLVAGFVGWWYTVNSSLQKGQDIEFQAAGKTYITPKGEKMQVTLSDGTSVLLNADSKLEVATDFNQQARLVRLSGEGYFEVQGNKDKPFVVEASDFNIKVLGTTFNVKSYPDEPTAEALLVEGSIEMMSKGKNANSVVIKPNQKITVYKEDTQKSMSSIKPSQKPTSRPSFFKEIAIENLADIDTHDKVLPDIAWKDNRLEIVDEDFVSLGRKLERWYNIEIEIKTEKIKDYRFTATFSKEDINQVLSALRKVQPFNYEIYGNKVVVSEK